MLVLECGSNGAGLWLAGDRTSTYIVFPREGEADVVTRNGQTFYWGWKRDIQPLPLSEWQVCGTERQFEHQANKHIGHEGFQSETTTTDSCPRIGIVHMDVLTTGLRSRLLDDSTNAYRRHYRRVPPQKSNQGRF